MKNRNIEKRNGKLTKTEKIRRIWQRAVDGESRNRWSYTELARWLGLDLEYTKYFIKRMNSFGFIASYEDKRSVVFYA
jgi:hypothetical protein